MATGLGQSDIIPLLEAPPSGEFGDVAFPCYILSPKLRKSPAVIASDIVKKISFDDVIDRVESKGPYVNFFFRKEKVISAVIGEMIEQGDDYGKSNVGKGKTIVIDYSSPNIAKPFGIGHLRSTVLGAALKRIFQYQGYKVVGINHLGDWGTQFGKVILAYKLWGDESRLEKDPTEHLYDLYVRIHQEEEKNPSLAEDAREEFRKLEDGEAENLSLWKRFSHLSKREFQKIYGSLGVEFEEIAGESFYNDKIKDVEAKLSRAGLLSVSREATIVDLEKYGLPPMLVKKSDDTTLYATRDLAAAIYRKEKYNFDKMLYVVGVAQALHFKQLFKVLALLGYEWAKDCHHVSFGWVKLGEEMMSTRRGNIVFLEDVISRTIELARNIIKEGSPDLPDPDKTAFQVGVGAVIFADLAYRRDSDISFDWDRMLDFNGSTGPYLQYTHARICSVIRKYGKPIPSGFSPELLVLPEEYSIIKKLGEYSDMINKAANEFEPYHISSFLLELCGLFNTYYQRYKSPEDRILSANENKTGSRVVLVECLRSALRAGLTVLGLQAPDMM
jgi:arginyl-tRNA synthetase